MSTYIVLPYSRTIRTLVKSGDLTKPGAWSHLRPRLCPPTPSPHCCPATGRGHAQEAAEFDEFSRPKTSKNRGSLSSLVVFRQQILKHGWLLHVFCSRSSTIFTGWWYTYPSENYEFVNWDDDKPNWIGTNWSHVPVTTNQFKFTVSLEVFHLGEPQPGPPCQGYQRFEDCWSDRGPPHGSLVENRCRRCIDLQ